MSDPLTEDLQHALVAAFTRPELDAFLRSRLQVSLDRVVNATRPYWTQVYDLIRVAESAGWLADLTQAVVRAQPDRPEIAALAQRSGVATDQLEPPATEQGGVEAVVQPSPTGPEGLESAFRHLPQAPDMGVWVEQLNRAAGRVCRVEVAGMPEGTGILVGPDVVLTSYQVVDWVIQGRRPSNDIRLRFDYRAAVGGEIAEGQLAHVSPDWLIDSSPLGSTWVEGGADRVPAAPDRLGHALIRLARPVGSEPGLLDPRPRGWVHVPDAAADIRPEMPVVILHYAGNNQPLKLVLDSKSLLWVSADRARVRYVINAGYVPAGAPCFDLNWNPFAIHQEYLVEPESAQEQRQGTLLAAIRDRLARLNRLDALGGIPP